MKNAHDIFTLRISVVAVYAALAGLAAQMPAAYADEAPAAEQVGTATTPDTGAPALIVAASENYRDAQTVDASTDASESDTATRSAAGDQATAAVATPAQSDATRVVAVVSANSDASVVTPEARAAELPVPTVIAENDDPSADKSVAAKAPAKPPEPVSSKDPAVADLVNQSSSIEVGAGYVSRGSYKFGEYNGLQNKGVFGVGDIDLRGGGAFDSDDATRWRIGGRDLGLETREGFLEYGKQGTYRFNLDYDLLRHNLSDSYETPYVGVGGSNLRLPATWLKPTVPQVSATALNYRALLPATGNATAVNTATGALVVPSAGQLATLNAIRAADNPAFHNVDLFTRRETTDVGFNYDFSNEWQLTSGWRHEYRNGLKATAIGNDFLNGNSSVTLPELIDQETDQYNLGVAYTGERGFLQAAYYGSFFRNHVAGMTWEDPNRILPGTPSQATYAEMPSNQFHQVTLTGGYHLTPANKVVVTASYGINTQDDAFLRDSSLPIGLPRTSLDGLVRTKLLDLKFTSRPTGPLSLTAGYKHDERDNETPISTFAFYDVNGAPGATPSRFNAQLGLAPNTLASTINIFDNRPESRVTDRATLEGDYRLSKRNTVAVGYDWERIHRKCEGAWIDCEDAKSTKEDTLKLEWRSHVTEDVTARFALAESQRRGNYNSSAWLAEAPMAAFIPSPVAGSVPTQSVYQYLMANHLTGWGPNLGFPATPLTGNAAIYSPNNNIVPQALYGSRDNLADLPGMRRYTVADRDRTKLRTTLTWDATERLNIGAGFDYNKDAYTESVYGLQAARTSALNLDVNYLVSEKLTTGAFYSYEELRSASGSNGFGSNSATANVSGKTVVSGGCYATVLQRNNNAKIDPCNNWWEQERDTVHTLGLTMRRTGLWGDRLDVGADLVYSHARTSVGVTGGTYANNPFAAAAGETVGIYYSPAADLPRVTTETVELRLDGEYHINKNSGLHMFYGFKHLKYGDYAYDGMQLGSMTTVMPTLEQAPNYSIHVIALTYQRRF